MKAIKGKAFFAGIHVKDRKALACGMATEVMNDPKEVYISLSQSLGKPAALRVEKGQKVKEGQLIAEADGAISSSVFASIAGEVVDIKEIAGANGGKETYVIIKGDGSGEKFTLPVLDNPDAAAIKTRIKEAGIVGLGGAGFPAAVKAAPRTPVDTLILNGAECEPYLTCDHRIMLENADEIARGARYIAKALGVDKIIIGIEANKPDCIAVFEKYDDILPVILKKQYPMGSEKHLIYVTTGRKVGIGKLPADSGVVVQNVATALAVCRAIEQGKTLYERVLTVSGKAIKNPKNLWVKVGTPVKEIIEYCGGEKNSIEDCSPKMRKDLVKIEQQEQEIKSRIQLINEQLALLNKDNSETQVKLEKKLEKLQKYEENKSVHKQRLIQKFLASIKPKKVIQGGPMTGLALSTYDVYTHKTTSGILLLSEDEAAAEQPTPCLNCGMCADVCPMHLMPMQTGFYAAAGDYEKAAKQGNTICCIECGACEYTCPAKRPLIQAIRQTKAYMRAKIMPTPTVKPVDQKGRSAPVVPLTEDGKHPPKEGTTPTAPVASKLQTDKKENGNGQ